MNFVAKWFPLCNMEPLLLHCHHYSTPTKVLPKTCNHNNVFCRYRTQCHLETSSMRWRNPTLLCTSGGRRLFPTTAATSGRGVPLPPLDLTEDNVKQVIAEARVELAQLFDTSVGITGEAELAELDGPFVKISFKGRFWHKRSTVLARLGNYLKERIPEILDVDIEDEKQLDDSPENF